MTFDQFVRRSILWVYLEHGYVDELHSSQTSNRPAIDPSCRSGRRCFGNHRNCIYIASRRLPIQNLQPTLNRALIIVILLAPILLQHNSPHQPPRRAPAREQLELRKPLFREDVKAVESHPAAVREGARLFHEGRVEGFIGQL